MDLADAERASIEALAYHLALRGRLDDAEALLGGLVTLAPEAPYAWRVLAVIARRRGEHAQADALERRASALERATDR